MSKIDPKLQKQLDSIHIIPHTADQTALEVVETLAAGHDTLVLFPGELNGHDHAMAILQKLSDTGQRIWYVAPCLTPIHAKRMQTSVSVQSSVFATWSKEVDRLSTATTILWSLQVCWDFWVDMRDSRLRPDRVILDARMACADPNPQLCWDEMCERFPISIPMVLLLDDAPNAKSVAIWLERLHQRHCRILELLSATSPTLVPVFLDSDQTLMLLLQGKRIANKVKQTLKEHEPHSLEQGSFVEKLLLLLKECSWLPALVVMTDAAACKEAWHRCSPQPVGQTAWSSEMNDWLDANPALQDRSRLDAIWSKRAMVLNTHDHPAWWTFAEILLANGQADIVLVQMGELPRLMTPVKTVVLLTTHRLAPETPEGRQPIRPKEMMALRQLTGRPGIDPVGLLLTAHTSDLDMVHLRNLLDSKSPPLSSCISPTLTRVPGLLAMESGYQQDITHTLAAYLRQSPLEEPFLAVFEGLASELPEARCISPRVMLELREIHLQLTFQINKLTWKSDRLDRVDARSLKNLQRQFAWLPCMECSHQNDCHRRGSKRLRTLVEEYYRLALEISGTSAVLSVERSRHLSCLRELEWIDDSCCLTGAGELAAGISGAYSLLLPLCAWNQLLPLDDPYLSYATVAGFVEHPELNAIRFVKEFNNPELQSIYQRIDLLQPIFEGVMLRFGYLTQPPSLAKAVFVLAWNQGADLDYITQLAGITPGVAVHLIETSAHLASRLRMGLKRDLKPWGAENRPPTPPPFFFKNY